MRRSISLREKGCLSKEGKGNFKNYSLKSRKQIQKEVIFFDRFSKLPLDNPLEENCTYQHEQSARKIYLSIRGKRIGETIMCRAWRKVTMVPFISVPPEAASIGSTEKKQFTACTDIDADYCYNMDITTKGYLAISNDHGLLIYHPQTKEKQLIDVESLHLSAINRRLRTSDLP